MNTRRRLTAIAAIAALAAGALLGGGLPASAEELAPDFVVADDAGQGFTQGRQTAIGLRLLWNDLVPTEFSTENSDSWAFALPDGLPPEVTELAAYFGNYPTGEPAWLVNSGSADPISFPLQATAVIHGAPVASNVATFTLWPQPATSPAVGSPPVGAVADFAWSARWATVEQERWWAETTTTGQIDLLAPEDQVSCSLEPASGVTADPGSGAYPTSPPTVIGEMGTETMWNAGLSDGLHNPVNDVVSVKRFFTNFPTTVVIDIPLNCGVFDLTGNFYLFGADAATGTAVGRSAGGTSLLGSEIDTWSSIGPASVAPSDVSVTPLPGGGLRFDFKRSPTAGETGGASTPFYVLLADGTQARAWVNVTWQIPGNPPPFRADTGIELTATANPFLPITLIVLALLLTPAATILRRRARTAGGTK